MLIFSWFENSVLVYFFHLFDKNLCRKKEHIIKNLISVFDSCKLLRPLIYAVQKN